MSEGVVKKTKEQKDKQWSKKHDTENRRFSTNTLIIGCEIRLSCSTSGSRRVSGKQISCGIEIMLDISIRK